MYCKYFDAHTHVQFSAYDADRGEVIERAHAAGVAMVNVGTQKDTSRRAVELAREYKEGVYVVVGLHPIHTSASYHHPQELGESFSNSRELEKGQVKEFTSRGEQFDHAFYKALAEDPRVVAVGECGLDYFRLEGGLSDTEIKLRKEKQKTAFEAQIRLAYEVKKPLMIHCRSAFNELLQLIEAHRDFLNKNNPGIIHFFSGTPDDAKKLLDLGFSFTFGGVITFTHDYDAVIKMLPIDRILSETDAPYVTPVPYRGKRNEPAYVIEVVKKLAELRGVSEHDMAAQTIANAERIFKITLS